jgi:hypothetical protein
MAKIKLTATNLTVNGKRAGVRIDNGPWIAGVPAGLIKIRSKKGYFPAEFRSALAVENKSDSREDYFEGDTIRLLPGDAIYQQALAALNA